jgi:2,3-bisphosphoglycerate-dependent phosphoglycerate mutase
MSATLILLRHGQSEWNQKNIFTGWEDVPLSKQGEAEALVAQKALANFQIDAVFVSALKRADDTAKIVLGDKKPAQYCHSEALNERHYGELQGKNKDEMRKKYSEKQVELWRRSFDVKPPGGESLKDTCDRVLPYFKREIEPKLKKGQTILISAHGNSLRALVKYLEDLSDQDIVNVEIPTGVPIVYQLDNELNIIKKDILMKSNT